MEDKVNEIYKQLLQNETSNHTVFISVLLGIVIILLGATWWWNKSGATKQISQEVEEKFNKERNIISLEIEKKIKDKFDEEIKKYENKILELEADISRVMAISAHSNKMYGHSMAWWSKNLDLHIRLDNLRRVRIATEAIITNIKSFEEKEEILKVQMEKEGKPFSQLKVYECNTILENVNKLPDVLSREKEIILEKLKNRDK